MADFSNRELTQIHYFYGVALGNAREAARLYALQYPDRRHPHHSTFTRVHQRMLETGSALPRREGNLVQAVRNPELEERVLQEVADDPTVSTRELAARLNENHLTVWRILSAEKFYPYHLQKVHKLYEGDNDNRIQFCRVMNNRFRRDGNFSRKILFSDEALFTRDGVFNSKNLHEWQQENPHATYKTHFNILSTPKKV